MNKMHCVRVICLGAPGIGKTDMLQTMARSEPVYGSVSTIGVDIVTLHTPNMNVRIWDTGGRPEFDSMLNAFKRDSQVTLLCYSDGNIDSFEWAKEKRIDGEFIVINLSKTNMSVAHSLMHNPQCLGGITYTPRTWAVARSQLITLLKPVCTEEPQHCGCTML